MGFKLPVDSKMSKAKRKTVKGINLEKLKASLSSEGVTLSEGIENLSSRGYGKKSDGKLVLAPYEALYLLDKGVIEVLKEKSEEELSFQDLLQHFRRVDKNVWVKFLIYRDLRNRGYVVREGFGFGLDFRLYDRGDYGKEPAKNIVFGILEGKPVSIKELSEVLRKAQNLKKKLILAVVNRRGEVVYYSLSTLTLGEVIEDVEV